MIEVSIEDLKTLLAAFDWSECNSDQIETYERIRNLIREKE